MEYENHGKKVLRMKICGTNMSPTMLKSRGSDTPLLDLIFTHNVGTESSSYDSPFEESDHAALELMLFVKK